ncbi:hypothetical protein T06_12634 [Trichinella sp. T6]|nr:hypothetical protein T06_12634 [Trichinella sp. T6]
MQQQGIHGVTPRNTAVHWSDSAVTLQLSTRSEELLVYTARHGKRNSSGGVNVGVNVPSSLRTRIYIFFLTSLRVWCPRLSNSVLSATFHFDAFSATGHQSCEKQGVQLALRNRCFCTRSNALLPRGFLDSDKQVLRKDFSTPPTPKDRVTVPCLVSAVADLITPSSLGWISMILPIGHLIHAVLGSCTSTIDEKSKECLTKAYARNQA